MIREKEEKEERGWRQGGKKKQSRRGIHIIYSKRFTCATTTNPATASTSHDYMLISNSDIVQTKNNDLCPIDRDAYDIYLTTKTLNSKQ